MFLAAMTGGALAVGVHDDADGRDVAYLEPGDGAAGGDDAAYHLVAGNHRIDRVAPLVADHVQVGVADAAVEDFDGDFRGAGFAAFKAEGSKGRLRIKRSIAFGCGHGVDSFPEKSLPHGRRRSWNALQDASYLTHSRPLGAGDAGNALEVGKELNAVEAGADQQRGDGLVLSVADFEGHETAWGEHVEGGGGEAAIDLESILAGEESHGRLVVAHLDGQRGAVGARDVGRVGDDDVESVFGYGGKQVAQKKADAAGNAVALRVFARNGQGGGGEVDGCDCGLGQLVGQRDGDGAGAGADIYDSKWGNARRRFAGGEAGGPLDDLLDQVLGLRAGNEDVARDAKGQAVELSFGGAVLDGFVACPPGYPTPELSRLFRGQLFVGMRNYPCPIPRHHPPQQQFCISPCRGYAT